MTKVVCEPEQTNRLGGIVLEQTGSAADRTLYHLKNGVVPSSTDGWPYVGRQAERHEMERLLHLTSSGQGSVKFISGDYGSGKTVFSRSVEANALQQGFVVSRIQLNKSCLINNWETFYAQLMHHLMFEEDGQLCRDFEHLFDAWIRRLRQNSDRTQAAGELQRVIDRMHGFHHGFARAFLTYIQARIRNDRELAYNAASWIKGEQNIPASLKATFGVKGSVGRNSSMDFLKAFVHLLQLLSYRGLLIVVDELDLIRTVRSDIRRTCYENVRFLYDGIVQGDFGPCAGLFLATPHLFSDHEKGIPSHPPLDGRLGYPGRTAGPEPADLRRPVLHFSALGEEELNRLTRQVIRLYQKAYDYTPRISPEGIRNWALLSLHQSSRIKLGVNTRSYLIHLVGILDTMQQHPGRHRFHSELKLVEQDGVYGLVDASYSKPNE